MSLYWILIPAAMAGVLLPKLVTAVAMPVRSTLLANSTRLLPAATLGAFTALQAGAWTVDRPQPVVAILVLAGAVVVAAALRRTFVVLAAGGAAVVALKLAGLL